MEHIDCRIPSLDVKLLELMLENFKEKYYTKNWRHTPIRPVQEIVQGTPGTMLKILCIFSKRHFKRVPILKRTQVVLRDGVQET